jgi:hypothetical protein
VAFDKSDLIREGLLYNTLIREVAFGKCGLIREGLLYNTLIREVAFGKSGFIREGLLYSSPSLIRSLTKSHLSYQCVIQ